jgi:hypothetical protein
VNKSLNSFLHLIKRSNVIKLGSDYLTLKNKPRLHLVLISTTISEQSKKQVINFLLSNNIPYYDVHANIFTSLYPGKSVKVMTITNKDSARKIANLMKEGESYE